MAVIKIVPFPGPIGGSAENGVSGSFVSQDGKTVTVTNGIITGIVGA
jgi:hypothetical protein